MILRPNAFARGRLIFTKTWTRRVQRSTQSAAAKKKPHGESKELPYSVEYQRPPGPAYPERLLIYHSGTPKAALVGFIKLSAIFFFAGTTLFIAPTFIEASTEPNWKAAPIIAVGTIPMLIVSIMTAPFVASVHMRVPAAARTSRAVLLRYCANLPPKTELDFTTVRLIGLPKSTSTTLGELRALRPRLGRLANIERVNHKLLAKRTVWAWLTTWMREPRNKFFVSGVEGVKRSRAPGVWELVWEQIQKKPVVR